MTNELQRLTGENKVLRDLLETTESMVESLLQEDIPDYEANVLVRFAGQINAALRGVPVDMLG